MDAKIRKLKQKSANVRERRLLRKAVDLLSSKTPGTFGNFQHLQAVNWHPSLFRSATETTPVCLLLAIAINWNVLEKLI